MDTPENSFKQSNVSIQPVVKPTSSSSLTITPVSSVSLVKNLPSGLSITKTFAKPQPVDEDEDSEDAVEVEEDEEDEEDYGGDDQDDDQDDEEEENEDDDDGEDDEDEDEDEEEYGDDTLAMDEDSNLEGSLTETSLIEPPEPRRSSQAIVPALLRKKPGPPSSGSTSPSMSSTPRGTPKRRGRPTRAEMERKEKEKQDKIARGESTEPTPKRRGRRPRTEEEKKKIREEKKQQKKQAKQQAKLDKKKEKLMVKQRAKEEKLRKKQEKEEKKRQKALERMRPETEEEREAKAQARRAKYEEFKRLKQEKAEKRKQRNEELRLYRLKKKEEEKKQREAYEKRMQELKASFLDETSHMSGNSGQVGDATVGGALLDETSQSSFTSQSRSRWGEAGMKEMSMLMNPICNVTSETLMEYRWPLEGKNSEYYFLQEQVSEYLGVKSFKRRYPDIQRRNVDHEERDFLVEIGVVTMVQADLGLTAIPSSQVLDIMSNDFYEKYDEYMAVVAERKDRNLRQFSTSLYTNSNAVSVPVEKHKMQDFVEKAVKSASEWNKTMNADRKEKRKSYFDLQTFNIHRPMNNRGLMKVVEKPKLGHYPIALIPGQFTDHYQSYSAQELSYLPLNTALKAPIVLKAGMRGFVDLNLKKEKRSDNCSLCSCSSCESDDGSDVEQERKKSVEDEMDVDDSEVKTEPEQKLEPPKLKKPILSQIPGARCKNCNGDRMHNKLGLPEVLLHCSNCDSSCHPTCLGLCLELLQYVTNYNWECTECKVCSKCKDHADEDKMLFCDLCDRGYHSYCVGLDEIPSGRWHCVECSECMSCKSRYPSGTIKPQEETNQKWAYEYRVGSSGNKIYSHSLCVPCHRAWKKSQYCPECNVGFGREHVRRAMEKSKKWKSSTGGPKYCNCWVCGRQHHAQCVSSPDLFICSACQKRTLEKSVGSAYRFTNVLPAHTNLETTSNPNSLMSFPSVSATPMQFSSNISLQISATLGRKSGQQDTSGPMTCEYCHKIYKNKSTLYSHKNRDHGVKGSSAPGK